MIRGGNYGSNRTIYRRNIKINTWKYLDRSLLKKGNNIKIYRRIVSYYNSFSVKKFSQFLRYNLEFQN